MPQLAPEILTLIQEGETFAFAFEFVLANRQRISLTNYSSRINILGTQYLNYSSLHLKQANFNDSAMDVVEISGIFDPLGIDAALDLQNADVAIFLIFPERKIKHLLLSMHVSAINKGKLDFTLYLKNHASKLSSSVTKLYSKTCRAKLGDAACGVDLEKMALSVRVLDVSQNLLTLENIPQPSGYYDYGKVRFCANNHEVLILKHSANTLMLERSVTLNDSNCQALLMPGCNKSISMCYERFANNLNFRGEPFIVG